MKNPRPSILIIDDSPTNLKLLTAALATDYNLQVAHSGAMGLQVALRQPPDLILLDVMMPEMNGFEVCQHIKSIPDLSNVPVIFLTAMGDTASETAGLSMGAADYITKPINVETAQHRIFNLLERERLRKEVEAHRDHLEEKVAARTMALSIAKEAVESSHRAKSNFLNNMTHELRTPMTVIMGYNEVSLHLATDPEQAEVLRKVQDASQQLLALITDLIDITTLESRQLTLDQRSFVVQEVMDGVMEQTRRDAASKGLKLHVLVAPDLSKLPLLGDPVRLGQILMALASNAIKFTHQGQVRIDAVAQEQSEQDVLMQFTVRDTGIGIAAEDKRHIFELFEQLDGSSTRHHGGTGLGLALCQQLIDLMGGRFDVESQPGVGSVFWFSVRLLKS